MQKSDSRLQDMRSQVLFFLSNWYESMAKWSRRITVSQATWIQFQQGAETLCSPMSPLAILRGTEPVSALTRCVLLNFFLWIRLWWSLTDRVLTLNMNIRLPLFWSTWGWARGPDPATCAGLAHGRDCSNCRASEQKSQNCLAIIFPWIVENTWKQGPTVRVFQTSSPRLL